MTRPGFGIADARGAGFKVRETVEGKAEAGSESLTLAGLVSKCWRMAVRSPIVFGIADARGAGFKGADDRAGDNVAVRNR